MKKLRNVNATGLAIGIQKMLLDMLKEHGFARYPIERFEGLVMLSKDLSKDDARSVTAKVLNTGIIQAELYSMSFVL